MKKSGYWGLLTVALLAGCRPAERPAYVPPENPLFVKLSGQETGLTFGNTVADDDSFNVMTYRNFYNGGGVAIGDVNNDGLADVYFTCNSGKNRLYLNRGNWKFDDVTDQAGVAGRQEWSTGVTLADVNGDGWLDIYVCNSGNKRGHKKENELFINRGGAVPAFDEKATEYGLNDRGYSTHAAFFDYDADGDLDCYVLNNSFKQIRKFDYSADLRAKRDSLGGHKLYQNRGSAARPRFVDVSEQAGIYGSEIGFGLGVSVADLNDDARPDLYVSNDFFERDYCYLNQGSVGGKNGFQEILPTQMGHTSLYSMGSDVADVNNDGRVDIFTTDMLPEDETRLKTLTKFDEYEIQAMKLYETYHYQYIQNALQINLGNEADGKPLFSERAFGSGVSATDWSWGALIFDFENDGWKDLLVCNGMYKDINNRDFIEFVEDRDHIKEIVEKRGKFDYHDILDLIPSVPIASYAFVNQRIGPNGELHFANRAHELGLGEPGFRNGAAYGDLDNDGDLDLVTNNLLAPCGVFRNDSRQRLGHHFLKVKLNGSAGNRFGVGATVRLWAGGQQQVLQQMPARGFQSCVEPVLLFGLGKATRIDSLDVRWPGGGALGAGRQRLRRLAVDQTLTLDYAQARHPVAAEPEKMPPPLLADVTAQTFSGNITHQENRFVDFNRERLIPHLLSTQGPKLAVGDLNGDGRDDVFIGAARGDARKLFVQQPNGTFKPSGQPNLAEDRDFEDAGAAFFDTDGDGDLDLMVASGGNETDRLGIVRLYVNDGKGQLKADASRSPAVLLNASCLRPGDYDGDGDLDVFVGGRSRPGRYGVTPHSYLLRNEAGFFKDATPPALRQVGMVTDAVWLDANNDHRPDLFLVGEWMPPTLFTNQNGELPAASYPIPNATGWWNCLAVGDLDGDGDADVVAGNWGTNTKFRASPEHPMEMVLGDFDQNEVSETLISYYRPDGQSYPYHAKGDVTAQVPSLKKRFLKYSDYAGQRVNDLFDANQMKATQTFTAQCLESSVFWNDGNGRFTRQALPAEAQVAPVMAISLYDINNDQQPDVLLGGNFYGVKPELGRHDASYGLVLQGLGAHRFVPLPFQESGLVVRGEVRDIQVINTRPRALVLVARNNQALMAWRKR
ncbi:MAG: VCBS repeat-containing protein [Cytophagaceae bacterium]|nr:VCBS repeat-containing protein [Cytophagaceae bacterium]